MSDDRDRLAGFFHAFSGGKKNTDLDGIFQFIIEGVEPIYFYLIFKDNLQGVLEGCADAPNITVQISADDLKDLILGELGSVSALLSGKIKIKGDMALAMKILALLKHYKSL